MNRFSEAKSVNEPGEISPNNAGVAGQIAGGSAESAAAGNQNLHPSGTEARFVASLREQTGQRV